MKKLVNNFYLLICGLSLMACTGSENTADVLNNPEKRDEIMTAIAADRDLMHEMMRHMMRNDHAMQMMIGSDTLRNRMMGGKHGMSMMKQNGQMMGQMMQMADGDSVMCKNMMGMMMKRPAMMGMMMDMMHEKGMMDKNCVMRGKQMLSEEGEGN